MPNGKAVTAHRNKNMDQQKKPEQKILNPAEDQDMPLQKMQRQTIPQILLTEYQKAQEEIRGLEERLERLLQTYPIGSKGFTKAGIRKMIARLHEELAVYEGSEEARQPDAN